MAQAVEVLSGCELASGFGLGIPHSQGLFQLLPSLLNLREGNEKRGIWFFIRGRKNNRETKISLQN